MPGSFRKLEDFSSSANERVCLDLRPDLLQLLDQVKVEWGVCSIAKVIELLLEELLLEDRHAEGDG